MDIHSNLTAAVPTRTRLEVASEGADDKLVDADRPTSRLGEQMANRSWMFNPGCATEPCCEKDDPVNTPCCTGLVPTTLYLSDGYGTVPMVYNGPRPVNIVTATQMWWGCATRAVTNGRAKTVFGDCGTTPISFDTEVVFGLWCKGPEGFRLYMFHAGCGSYDDGINVQTHQRKSLGCATAWGGQYNHIVGGSINGIAASDCRPFTFGPISQNFPATPYPHHPLREIYGDSTTWTMSE